MTEGPDRAVAVELFHADGTSAGVFYCSKCRYVGPSENVARTCCVPKVCEDCGEEYERPWAYVVCRKCHGVRSERQARERWEATPKVPGREWTGPLVTDGQEGYADGFWNSLDELESWLEDEGKTLQDVRCYATRPVRMHGDADQIVEWMCEEQHEGAYGSISGEAVAELQGMLDAWCEKHGTVTRFEDESTALSFDPEPPR